MPRSCAVQQHLGHRGAVSQRLRVGQLLLEGAHHEQTRRKSGRRRPARWRQARRWASWREPAQRTEQDREPVRRSAREQSAPLAVIDGEAAPGSRGAASPSHCRRLSLSSGDVHGGHSALVGARLLSRRLRRVGRRREVKALRTLTAACFDGGLRSGARQLRHDATSASPTAARIWARPLPSRRRAALRRPRCIRGRTSARGRHSGRVVSAGTVSARCAFRIGESDEYAGY